MAIKELMITGSNEGPNVNDDWVTSIPLDAGKDYTKKELIDLVETQWPYYVDNAIWYYSGEDYKDTNNVTGKNMKLINGAVRYFHMFNPWDTDNVILIQNAEVDDVSDSFNEEWRHEVAMQAGMMGGCSAYNEVMGY